MSKLTVLLTAAGSPGFAGHCYSLRKAYGKKIRIIGVDMLDDVYGKILADEFHQVPPADDDRYLNQIYSLSGKVDAIFPLSDHELLPLTKYRNELSCPVIAPDYAFIQLCHNKRSTYEFFSQYKRIPTPTLHADIWNADCMKPEISCGSRGFFRFSYDDGMLLDKERRDIFKGIGEDIIRKSDRDWLLMDYIEGIEYSVDLMVTYPVIHALCIRRRDAHRQGITYTTTIVEDHNIRHLCERIIKHSINYGNYYVDGPLNIQVKGNPPTLIEINPRLSGSAVMCTHAGVNFPYLALQHALDKTVPSAYPNHGMKIYRHWTEVF